ETRLKASALLAALEVPEHVIEQRNSTAAQACKRDTPAKPGEGLRVLMVDHQDSFVHTLSSYFQETGATVRTVRPDGVEAVLECDAPALVVLSPGPGRPANFQVHRTLQLCIERKLPVFGV